MGTRKSKGTFLRGCTICSSFSNGDMHLGKPICKDCIELIKRLNEIV